MQIQEEYITNLQSKYFSNVTSNKWDWFELQIRLCDYDIESNLSEAFQSLGYCPQHDALWDNITLREHIELYAIVRGVKPNIRNKWVQSTKCLTNIQVES